MTNCANCKWFGKPSGQFPIADHFCRKLNWYIESKNIMDTMIFFHVFPNKRKIINHCQFEAPIKEVKTYASH